MSKQKIYIGKTKAQFIDWLKNEYHYMPVPKPVADPKTHIKFSDGTEFYDVIEFPDGLDGVFDLRTAVKYGWTNKGSDGYGGEPQWDNKHPVEAVLGSNITSIGQNAFSGCRGLTSVAIPCGVTSISSSAFSGCSGLTSVTIPNSVTSIGSYAFSGCSGLTSVTIPTGVTSIGNAVFKRCGGLTSVTIPSGVTSIGDQAFTAAGLTSIAIPDSVTSIGFEAFLTCRSLTSVTIGTSVMNIGDYAFQYCQELTSIEFEGNAPTVGKWPFDGVAAGCKAIISSTATGFNVDSQGKWNGLIVEVKQ